MLGVRTCEQWGKREEERVTQRQGRERETWEERDVQDPGEREGMKGEISRVVGGRYDDATYCDWCDILTF